MGKSAPSAPPPPDYAGAANATAAGNLDVARLTTAANRVNQVTPYGNIDYTMGGEDKFGNPTWTATQSLAPEQQQLLDIQNQLSIGTGQLGQKGLGYVENMISQPFDTSSLPTTGFNAGQSYQDAYMQRLQPQIQQGREALNVDLANRGIPVGSEAYKRAMMSQAQKENDLLLGATTQGFGTGLSARQQGFTEASYQRNEPINTLNAVRTGAQVTNPNFVSVPQQATTRGADLLGAATAQGNANTAANNAASASQSGMTSGLMSLAGTAAMAF